MGTEGLQWDAYREGAPSFEHYELRFDLAEMEPLIADLWTNVEGHWLVPKSHRAKVKALSLGWDAGDHPRDEQGRFAEGGTHGLKDAELDTLRTWVKHAGHQMTDEQRAAIAPIVQRAASDGDLAHLRIPTGTTLYRGDDAETVPSGVVSWTTDKDYASLFGDRVHTLKVWDETKALSLKGLFPNLADEGEVLVHMDGKTRRRVRSPRGDDDYDLGDVAGHPFRGNQYTDAYPSAARDYSIEPVKGDTRACCKPGGVKTALTKPEQGAIGEAIVAEYLAQQERDQVYASNAGQPNFPIDLVSINEDGSGEVIEVKAGSAGNSKGAQQWRLTIGEPGEKEKALLAEMSPEDKARWNDNKEEQILVRKEIAMKQIATNIGRPVKGRTLTVIINPDTKVADVFEFDGFHQRIGWNSQEAKQGFKGTFKYRKKPAPPKGTTVTASEVWSFAAASVPSSWRFVPPKGMDVPREVIAEIEHEIEREAQEYEESLTRMFQQKQEAVEDDDERTDLGWDEGAHPRDERGRFAGGDSSSGGGGTVTNIPAGKKGECFRNAARWVRQNDDFDLVHGKITNGEGRTFDHAWAESHKEVADPTTGVKMDKDRWYDLVKAQPEAKYSSEHATVNLLRTGNFGPWTVEEVGKRKLALRTDLGDAPGHPFRGNQYTGGEGGGEVDTWTSSERGMAWNRWNASRSFVGNTGFDYLERDEVVQWATELPKDHSDAINDYAGFGYGDMNAQLRGTYVPRSVAEYVRPATPEEIAAHRPSFHTHVEHYKEDDPTNKVEGGRIIHNVFTEDPDGKKVEWSVQRVVPDLKAVADLDRRNATVNEGIRKHGYVLPEAISVNRAAYIPGLSFDELKAQEGGVMHEKGFTSTMVGDPHGRLDSYVANGKHESVYKRTGGKTVDQDEVGTAMRIQIVLPEGTKVAAVEPVRRIERTYPRVQDPEVFKHPEWLEDGKLKAEDFTVRDYTAKPKIRTDDIKNKSTRREAEILLGSGANFRIVSVEQGKPIPRSPDGSVREIPVADVVLEYAGGGSSDPGKD